VIIETKTDETENNDRGEVTRLKGSVGSRGDVAAEIQE
jgi:hypothetical protein